jgi:IclR family pca regulon transcriptional regulator
VVLDGDQVVIVARSGSTRVLAYGLHLGARLPAHSHLHRAGAAGRQEQGRVQCLDEGQGAGSADRAHDRRPRKFRALIEEVRSRTTASRAKSTSWASTRSAVPLRNMQGQTVAALNVVRAPQRLRCGR